MSESGGKTIIISDRTQALGYLSPAKFMEAYKKKSKQLYPQTANGNPSQIEESRLVNKAVTT
jgi:hypothetical protein